MLDRNTIVHAVLNEPTWVNEDSYMSQIDMRLRCAMTAVKAHDAVVEEMQRRINELEAKLAVKSSL